VCKFIEEFYDLLFNIVRLIVELSCGTPRFTEKWGLSCNYYMRALVKTWLEFCRDY
jgi:hypothetical protein